MEYHHGPEDSDLADIAFDRAEAQRHRDYPRGQGPTYDQLAGEDSSGPEIDDPEGFSLDQHDPDRYLDSPGFAEDEVDDWPDPDHGREAAADEGHYDDYDSRANDMEYNLEQEEHRHGAVLRQADQWPDRVSANVGGHGLTEDELAATGHGMQHHDIKIMRGKDTGLYGEDEDHPQDIIGMPNDHGGFDVIRHLN